MSLIYTVQVGHDYEGEGSIAAFVNEQDALDLVELLEAQMDRLDDHTMYGDYRLVSSEPVFSSLAEYLASDNAYDPFEDYD